jgi:hypothetical protein
MPNLRPFRDVNEHDVVNLFKISGTVPVTKGTMVKIVSGWDNDQEVQLLGSPGASYNNTVTQRYGVQAQIAACNGSGDNAVGVLLYDVRETDENGERLIFNPRKAAQMQCVLSGQAVPFATKGVFLYSGVGGVPTGGAAAYLATDGGITAVGTPFSTLVTKVGTFLGQKDSRGWTLFKLDL